MNVDLKISPFIVAKQVSPLYRGKPIKTVLAMAPSETLSVSTINKYLNRLSTLFEWAQRHAYTSVNPFEGLGIKKTTPAYEDREAFDANDLTRLFSSEIFALGHFKHPYQYWLPLLGLYTGARINELCQLRLGDIRTEDSIWVIDINSVDGKRVKSRAGRRLIPLHSRLIDLGFLDYVARLQAEARIQLFSELKRQRDGHATQAGKWFNERYKRQCGIESPKRTFHSFRHTVINQLKQKGCAKEKIQAIVGQKDGSVTFDVYGVGTRLNLTTRAQSILTKGG